MPTPASPAEMMRHWFQTVWNEGNPSLIEAWIAPNAPVQGMDGGRDPIIGPIPFRAVYDGMNTAFPDIQIELLDVTETATQATGRWVLHLTHSGAFKNAPATGKRISITGMTIIRFTNGQMTEAWNEWDRLTLALETGAVLAK